LKTCTICHLRKSSNDFYVYRRQCKQCIINRNVRHNLVYRIRNRQRVRRACRSLWHRNRDYIISCLGGFCVCCGESRKQLLTIDHVHGNGSKHRAQLGRGGVIAQIIRNGCPKDKYRILCMNCNSSFGHYGYCPHNETQKLLAILRCSIQDKANSYTKKGLQKYYSKLSHQKIRLSVINLLGGCCAICGAKHIEFLVVDHINGGGCKHHKERTGYGVYRDVLNDSGAKKKYCILCSNCNMIDGIRRVTGKAISGKE
jgi:hypothetical protein